MEPKYIYVASSWKNKGPQQEVVALLRNAGYEVYDFTAPPGRTGFGWQQIDPDWPLWTGEKYLAALKHPVAQAGFKSDMAAMRACDLCVLVQPCGPSAHLEAGWCKGAGRPVISVGQPREPDLMLLAFDRILLNHSKLVEVIRGLEASP